MDALQQLHVWFSEHFSQTWVIEIFFMLLITGFLHVIELITYRRLMPKLQQTKYYWDDALAISAHKPFGILIWFLGISYAVELSATYAHELKLFTLLPSLRRMVILGLFVWFLVRFVRAMEDSFLMTRPGSEPYDQTTVRAISQILVASIIITSSLVAMQMQNVPISGVLAFGGLGGAAVAFAAKDLLGNFFGGLMIFLDRPFSVGERISCASPKFDGVVENIGWRLTRIRTLEKRAFYIPNGIFSTICIENPSRMSHRRIHTLVGVRYDDANKISAIVDEIDQMLNSHDEIDTKQRTFARFYEFGASSLNIIILCHTVSIDLLRYQTIKQEIYLNVLNIIAKHGAECAFPTHTVYMKQE